MRTSGVIFLLVVLAGALDAQAPTIEYKRTFFAVGAAFTIGDNVQTDSVGGVQIADTKFAVVGWRGEMVAPWLGLDVSLSPVAGARITGSLIHGSAYVGICPAVGLYVRCTPAIDVGLSYQPVVNLFNFGGAEEARNKTYHDIVLSISFRSFTEVKKLDWE